MYTHLKELRESLEMTQEEFGKSIDIAKSTYNNYEKGIREPKSDFWVTVAQKYDVTIDYLMGYSDDPHGTVAGTSRAPLIIGMRLAEIAREKNANTYGGLTYEQLCQLGEYNARERLDAAFAKLDLIGREKVAEYAEKLARDPKRQRDPEFPYTRWPQDDSSKK